MRKQVVGIDEVGRGCWAGPLVAGAVILGNPIVGLSDSKLLSAQKRELLAEQITAGAAAYGLGWVWPSDIDASGLTESVRAAMKRAVAELQQGYDEIIVDGAYNFLADLPGSRTLIGADKLEPSVSAASIIAKVARDTYMKTVAEAEHPGYGFARHVGYGTAEHIRALHERGVTPLHRQSFKPIQKILLQSRHE